MFKSKNVLLLIIVTLGSIVRSEHSLDSVQNVSMSQIDLFNNLECQVPGSNEVGIMKFVSECPAAPNKTTAAVETTKICDYEVCSDLICCPATTKTRLKKVCSYVDNPYDTLYLRLHRNQECTVKALNRKGIYQNRCDFAERNPELKSILNNVCNEVNICKQFYCCPIEDDDQFYCTAGHIENAVAKFVGPKCVDTKSGRQGTCRKDMDLTDKNYLDFDVCGTYCCRKFYCDPDTDSSLTQTISTRECASYTKYLSKEEIEVPMDAYINQTMCTAISSTSIGFFVSPGEYPHMAALGYESDQQILWNCAGSLISDRFVLTAAKCLINIVKKVRLGMIDLLNDLDTADCPEDYNVARVIPHPEYNPKYVYNDIGLIQLVDRVQFNFYIRPICLPSSSDYPKLFLSLGWQESMQLFSVHKELVTNEECHEYYQNNERLSRGILNDTTQICAGSKDTVQSTCAGDAGGPLFARHNTHRDLFLIYGVISFGTVCGFADKPGLHTNVFPYVKWIEGLVWSN